MPIPPKIEPARKRDALPSLALHREVLAEGRWFISYPEELLVSLPVREHQIRTLSDPSRGCFLVARLPGTRVAGFVVVSPGGLQRTRHVGRLEVMVAQAHRGQGLGRALLRAAVSSAQRSEVLTRLTLAVFADNHAAIALYRSVGFVQEGHRIGEYREADGTPRDDLLMAMPV